MPASTRCDPVFPTHQRLNNSSSDVLVVPCSDILLLLLLLSLLLSLSSLRGESKRRRHDRSINSKTASPRRSEFSNPYDTRDQSLQSKSRVRTPAFEARCGEMTPHRRYGDSFVFSDPFSARDDATDAVLVLSPVVVMVIEVARRIASSSLMSPQSDKSCFAHVGKVSILGIIIIDEEEVVVVDSTLFDTTSSSIVCMGGGKEEISQIGLSKSTSFSFCIFMVLLRKVDQRNALPPCRLRPRAFGTLSNGIRRPSSIISTTSIKVLVLFSSSSSSSSSLLFVVCNLLRSSEA
mmetsp:Transcript_32171/g.58971  ORF Transcript_32171/g.58971 Transcript_32171/m.58971 type:complete len:292 (-) Transcript_32171:120-995(-)